MIRTLPGAVFGDVFGSGDTHVLALHGWGRTHRDFVKMSQLEGARDVTITAIDLFGFGATPAPDSVWNTRRYAEALVPLVESFSSPPIILGHSRGGAIGVCLSSLRPDLVRGLVVTGSPLVRLGEQRRPKWSYRMVRAANRVGLISDAAMEKKRQSSGSADYRAATGIMREILVTMVNETFEDELGSLAVPTHFVWGDADHDVPVGVATKAQALVTQARCEVTVLAGTGHLTVTEKPLDLLQAVVSL